MGTAPLVLVALVARGLSSTASPRALPPSVCSDDGAKVRYFAFGSNLLRSKMDGRGDTQVLEVEKAIVDDHRLAFNMRMFPPLEPSMASIEPARGSVCEGALYTLTRDGYEALWRSEGGAMAKPGYEEVVVDARVGGEMVQAITLRAAPWMRLNRDAPPSARYKKLIVDGAREVGLSDAYVDGLASLPAASPSAALTAIARAHGVIAVLLFKLKLRNIFVPYRSACYFLLRAHGALGHGVAGNALRIAAEVATAALLLPTAILGAACRLFLRLLGKESLVQFGPPPSKRPPAIAQEQQPSSESGRAVAGV